MKTIAVEGGLIIDPGIMPDQLRCTSFATSPVDPRNGPLFFQFDRMGLPGEQRATLLVPVCSQVPLSLVLSFEYDLIRDLRSIGRIFHGHTFEGWIELFGPHTVGYGIRDGDVVVRHGPYSYTGVPADEFDPAKLQGFRD